jgi:hypothetical protein
LNAEVNTEVHAKVDAKADAKVLIIDFLQKYPFAD